MDLIIGGAYQGKLALAKKKFGLADSDVSTCSEESGIRFGAGCVDKIEEFTLWCVRNQKDATEVFRSHRDEWQNSILICQDIFCGVVPMGAEKRAWRETTGRLCAYLAQEADTVTRVFCGLEQKLK